MSSAIPKVPECRHVEWVRDQESGDYCAKCGQTWLAWARGFGGNTTPMHKKPEPLVRPISD